MKLAQNRILFNFYFFIFKTILFLYVGNVGLCLQSLEEYWLILYHQTGFLEAKSSYIILEVLSESNAMIQR